LAENPELPGLPEPELATLVDEPRSGDDFIQEIKLDGYRVLARLGAGDATLHTRSGKDWTAVCRRWRAALKATGIEGRRSGRRGSWRLNEQGVSNFQTLQTVERKTRYRAGLFVSTYCTKERTPASVAASRAQSRLRALLERHAEELGERVRFSAHVVGHGARFSTTLASSGSRAPSPSGAFALPFGARARLAQDQVQ